MKVLVATSETQRQRKNDFDFVPDGELVGFGFECDGETVDGGCGCRRSMVGLKCHKATTTFMVATSALKASEYADAICQSLVDGGWGELEGLKDMANSDAIELARIAKFFPVGTILEKRGGKFQARKSS